MNCNCHGGPHGGTSYCYACNRTHMGQIELLRSIERWSANVKAHQARELFWGQPNHLHQGI
jgi:hypothetical protein